MFGFLKQSTASQSRLVGPFVDDTDFKTLETALTIANTDVKLSKNGGTSVNKNSGGGTHIANGMYALTFDATDTNTVGELAGSISVAGALVVVFKFWVLEEAIYDALLGASAAGFDANARVNVGSWLGTAVTVSTTTNKPEVDVSSISDDSVAANNLEADYDGTGYNKSNSTIGTCTTNTDMRGTDNAALASVCTEARLSELDAATSGKMANQVDIIQTDTSTDIPALLPAALVGGRIDANVGAISTSATAADNLEQSALGIVVGSATGTPTTTVIGTDLTETTTDHYKGRILTFVTGSVAGQSTDITAYNGSTKELTVTALTNAPASGDAFVIT